MRAPQQGRSRDEIVSEALKVINPPADQLEALRAKLLYLVNRLPRLRQTTAQRREQTKHRREQLQRYRNHLLAARRARPDLLELSEDFAAALDAEIDLVQRYKPPHGKRPRDRIAEAAVIRAADFLSPERRTLTDGGDWHLLAVLLYESASGQPDRDHVLRYCREMKHGKILRRPLHSD